MRNLNQVELSAIAGCGATLISSERDQKFAVGAGLTLMAFAVIGVQKVMIDAIKPFSSSIVDINILSMYGGGEHWGSPQHITCLATAPVAIGTVLGLATMGAVSLVG